MDVKVFLEFVIDKYLLFLLIHLKFLVFNIRGGKGKIFTFDFLLRRVRGEGTLNMS